MTDIVLVTASRQGCYLRLIACCPGEGRAGRTLRSSSGPTSVVFNLVYGRPYPAHRLQALPSSSSSVFFFSGGLGVGEKPVRGELVESTNRVPSPFISSQRFPFETFRVRYGKYGAGNGSWPFPPRCASFVCVERSRAGTPERAARALPIKGVELYGVTADPSRAGDRTLSPAGSRMPVETPNQRDPAAAHEERSAFDFA